MGAYGSSWERYKVGTGEVWMVGPHILLCGDLELGAAERLLAITGAPDVVYVDPPWNAAHARGYRTKAGVDGATGRKVDFVGQFLPMLMGIVKCARYIGVEIGSQHNVSVQLAAEEAGIRVVRHSAITYARKTLPCSFLELSTVEDDYAPPGIVGEDEPVVAERFAAAAASAGQTLFDPCMGQGLAATAGIKAGLRVVGVELHPRRMAVTIEKIVKATGHQAVRT